MERRVGAVLPLSLLLVVPTSSLAGEGNVPRGAASAAAFAAPHAVVRVVPASPNPAPKLVAIDLEAAAHCARSPALVGDACSFSTGMTSRRVVEDGSPWSWTGVLEPRALEGDIATPYTVDEDRRVLATELLELLQGTPHIAGSLLVTGRTLEIDSVEYVVLTSFLPVDM